MMTARARTHASPGVTAARKKHIPSVAGQTRLPWWAAVLPVLAFVMLLGLLLGGGEASAAQQQAAGGDLLAQILERVEQALLG